MYELNVFIYLLCFQGHFAHVETADEVKAVIAKLYEDRKIAKAAHNMYAYRIKQAGGNVSILETVVFCIKNLEEIQNQTSIR